ncbi:protein FAM162B-like [Pristis pectinata]|uniref:protein FAM162B-like n=1 Tax=Pristis pectinata TaxID=685728 RepID=UPI00223DA12D|nr:protein FAM162B-like [Pristis pectinata]
MWRRAAAAAAVLSRTHGAAPVCRSLPQFAPEQRPVGRQSGRCASSNPRESERPARDGAVTVREGEGRPAFKLPGHKPSSFDKKFLIWTGRFRREEDIPAEVSVEMIHAARNKIRVKGCYLMVVMTIIGCIGTIISGKKAAKRQESLTAMNMEKKAKLKASQQEVKVTKSQ